MINKNGDKETSLNQEIKSSHTVSVE